MLNKECQPVNTQQQRPTIKGLTKANQQVLNSEGQTVKAQQGRLTETIIQSNTELNIFGLFAVPT